MPRRRSLSPTSIDNYYLNPYSTQEDTEEEIPDTEERQPEPETTLEAERPVYPGKQEIFSKKLAIIIMQSRSYDGVRRYIRILNDLTPLKPALHRLVASGIYYGICLYIMSVMAVVSGMRYPKHLPDLPDLGFELLPIMDQQQTTIPNTLLLLALVGTGVRALFHDKGATIIRRFLIIHGTTALLRCICLAGTSYPDPNRLCVNYHPPSTTALFWQETVVHRGFLTCGDLMFSGHTLVYVLIALVWHKYFTRPEKIIVWILMIFACFSLVATRMHYTDDVLIALYIAVTSFYLYHHLSEPHMRKKNSIMAWLENDYVEEAAKIEKEDLLVSSADIV